MKIEMEVRHAGSVGGSWKEEYDCGDAEPKSYAENMIRNFNNTLQYGEVLRELVGVRVIGEGTDKHQWEKTNMYTLKGRGGYYDTMKCKKCGVTGKRYGIGSEGVKMDSKYRANKHKVCSTT